MPNTAAGTIRSVTIQSDNKIILGGKFSDFDGNAVGNVCRLNADGTYDSSFVTGLGINGTVYATAVQSDGKIIVAGDFSEYDGESVNNLVRLNADGSWDEDFTLNDDVEIDGVVYAVALQSDGKIVVGGKFSTQGAFNLTNFTRINADGSLDSAFDAEKDFGFSDTVYALAVQSDQKIVVGGEFTLFNDAPAPRLARINTDGSLDSAFMAEINDGANGSVLGLAVQSDQKIVAVGQFLSFNGAPTTRIVRLNTDGTRDTAFTTNNGTGFEGFATSVAVQSNGQIVVGGSFVRFNSLRARQVARLNTSGTGDTAFNTNIDQGANATVYAVAPRPDGTVFIGGDFNFFNYRGWVNFSIGRRFEDGVWRNL